MNIQGLQKLTLLDYPGKVACTVFTGGCNFRCPFCHNGDLVLSPGTESAWSYDALFSFLKKRIGILDGVCITGGEPMLQPDLEEWIRDIKALGYLVKLDTNGSYPDRLRHLVENGLADYVAMDIKNSRERYRETAGLPESYDLTPICDSVSFLLQNTVPYEFRTTIVQEYHRPQDIVAISEWVQGAKRYYLQSYEESENVINPGLHAHDAATLQSMADSIRHNIELVAVRGV